MIDFTAFADELEKISVQLNREERHRQALQFTGLGALAGPVIGGVGNLIQHGKFGPTSGTPLKKWIPATMVTGALISGAMPALRGVLTKRIEDQARARIAGG